MKKFSVLIGALCGALAGLVAALADDLGTQFVLAAVGAIAGVALGGAIAGMGAKRRTITSCDDDALLGMGVTPEDLATNYWRDQGRPPLASPLQPEYGPHQFDPDKL